MVVLVKRENKHKDKGDKDTVENKKTSSSRMTNTSVFIACFIALIFITGLSGVVSACETYVLVNPGESIQDAIDSLCPEGGVVELAAGTYYLPQGGTINLTIHANQKTTLTPIQVEDLPDGTHHWIGYKDYKYAIILNEKHNITIRGAGINDTILINAINAGESYPEYHMIFIVKGSNNIIEDLSIKNNYTGWIPDDAGNGIKIFGKAENIAISNIKAERFSAGIGAGVTLHVLKEYHAIENLTVSNCLLTYNKIGIVGLYLSLIHI